MILLLSKYVTVDQPFTIYVPHLLNHKIVIIGRTVVRIVVHMSWTPNKNGFWGPYSNQKLSHCCGLNICVLPKSVCWNVISSVMVLGHGALGKFLGFKGEGVLNGIHFLINKRHPRDLLCLFLHATKQQGDGGLRTRKWVLTRYPVHWYLDPGLPNLQNC